MKDKNKLIVLVSGVLVILLMVLGISFAVFRFGTDSSNQELVLGDIWMKYAESNGISLENALPGDEYTNYFEFQVTGTNTYTKKDIFYDISLTHGDTPAGKTEENRIADKYLKFKLTEVVGNTETEIFTDKTYDDLSNKRVHVDTISKSTNTFSKTYRLYMVISEELTYGNSSDAILTTEEFGKIFGSIKVNVTGDFNEKEIDIESINWFDEIVIRNNEEYCSTYIKEDGITYLSGDDCIDFNYVWYSGKLWRITAIYPDGTMKMITDDVITTLNWGEKATISSSNLTSAYSTSYIREWLNQEFLPTLYNYENIIDVAAGWYSITDSNSIPVKPTGEYTLTDPVGLLNAYEYYMSYKNANYGSGYLAYGSHWNWWLITPSNSSEIWFVDSDTLRKNKETSSMIGVRPVIKLKSTIEINGGTGDFENPYILKGDIEEAIPNTTLLNTRISGEYVKFDDDEEQIFRIVEKEKIGEKLTTKLVLNSLVMENDDYKSIRFTNSSTLWSDVSKTDISNARGYLNTVWIETLNTEMLEKGMYYLGEINNNNSYKNAVCSIVSSDISIKECIERGIVVSNKSSDDYVGMLRLGEMFVSQSATRNYSYWLITPSISSGVIASDIGGVAHSFSATSLADGVRPTINLKSEIVIKSGSGTEQDPFVVKLQKNEEFEEESGDSEE